MSWGRRCYKPSQATVEAQSAWDQMERDLKREDEDIRVSFNVIITIY